MIAEWWLSYMTSLVNSIPIPEWDSDITLAHFSWAGIKLGAVGCWIDLNTLTICLGLIILYGAIFLAMKATQWVASLVRG